MSHTPPDSLNAWIDYYLHLAIQGVRSPEVMEKIRLYLQRYGQERISVQGKLNMLVW